MPRRPPARRHPLSPRALGRSLPEQINRRYEERIPRACLDDRTRGRIALKPRERIDSQDPPARRCAVGRARRQSQAVHARVGSEFRKTGARGLVCGDAEKSLHVPAIGPGQTWSGKEGEALAGSEPSKGVEPRDAALSFAADVGRDVCARQDSPAGVDGKESREHGALDIAQTLKSGILRFLPAAQGQIGTKTPTGIAVEIDAESANPEKDRPVGK